MGSNPSSFPGDNNPVETVSWYDAVHFCNKLSEAEGLTKAYTEAGDATTCNFNANGYRLPTEAEWEYACKAGTTTDFYSGDMVQPNSQAKYLDTNLDRIGWYAANSGGTTHPVGQKQPNTFGLFDMSGNVDEWCWDWISPSYSAGSVTDPTGPGANQGSGRTCRGGSYDPLKYVALWCRSAFRYGYLPSSTFDGIGFRVVRSQR